ncbi:Inner centromere -related pic1 [Hyphodiscus hymeniophilus]|uniref:Inner centromere -related pic1 n=1 Tax=Hyphodiscus hymeniophilus TaxID=353542 RepID=A0A9P7AXN5_9HELO|nr:Inner centromere -related pic1 [Hyphodiscus hymeniophilus]
MRANPRLQVGSSTWISEERASALQIAEAEAEEFTFSARNEMEWLNEHMAEIFNKNQVNVAEIFKTPGKLRGKTPRTIRKNNPLEGRAPLTDVFSSTPRGGPTPTNFLDSGYHGSQMYEATQPTQLNEAIANAISPRGPTPPPKDDIIKESPVHDTMDISEEAEERRTTEGSFQSAKEEQTRNVAAIAVPELEHSRHHADLEEATHPIFESPLLNRMQQPASPQKRSPERAVLTEIPQKLQEAQEELLSSLGDEPMDDVRSPSEGSSPLRPIVRKSSLNFASLPAREPITTKKSLGNRVSRTSQLDQTRTSYYGRQTGGKSLGNSKHEDADQDDEMDIDEMDKDGRDDLDSDAKLSRIHNKTSTQRLQDQISMLGKSQSNMRPSKSIASAVPVHLSQQPIQPSQALIGQEEEQPKSPARSPQRQSRPFVAPGAFPEDEDDSWIGPPTAAAAAGPSVFSPRPQMTKYHSTDVMEGIHGNYSIGGAHFNMPKRGDEQRQRSPLREQPSIPDRTTSTLSHIKSVSTSALISPRKVVDSPGHKKTISVSNPNPSVVMKVDDSTSPPKSPSRSYRGSPLKAAKDKFSSILKTSRGLFASSAAVSAEAKTSALSPPSNRIGMKSVQSFEDVLHSQTSYPDLDSRIRDDQQSQPAPHSPGKTGVRRTRASTEREERRKVEEAKEAKESKEAQKMAEQLEKARSKVKEEAHVHHLEQERVAAMQKQIAARKEQEKLAKASQIDVPRATRSSPRKTKAQLEAEGVAAAVASVDELAKDTEMSDASAMPPPAVSRPKSQIGRPAAKRPLKPAKEPLMKAKQPPTVIRVDTGSQRGHQYHPSTSTLAATLQESLAAPASSSQGTLRSKASISSIQSKSSTSSFKSAATKALEAAARKKEQDELVAQRKREAKLDIERQRAAMKEEERRKEEQQRRQEATRQREIQREREQAAAEIDAKKSASRQAIEKRRLEMEKAKQTKAPPPAIRPQPSGDLKISAVQDKALPPAPPQRGEPARMNTSVQRPQEDFGRSVNSVLQNTAKAPPKRPLQQDADEHHSRPTIQRNPASYLHNDTHNKRRKTSEAFDDDDEDMTEPHPKMTAPPIRQSSSRPKEMPTKSLFPSGYANAPQTGNLQRSTLISQHNMNQSKPAHPMDMAQVSKAPIPFAPSQASSQTHKTPARTGAPANGGKSAGKSTARSSPRYQNGENIELPEINTDSEDDDDDDAKDDFVASAWTNSPALRKQLDSQETMDPSAIFGQPGPLNMEEVFPKNKEKFHKFRARTSSANWSGQDRLTDDEIRKDLEARDRLRRQGGWTYNDMV